MLLTPCTTSFLCNTSGSGKTRLLFEGLWRYFGLYFTASTKPDGIGSGDLEQILEQLPRRLVILTDDNWETALPANQDVAKRRFLSVLYARLLIFRTFLECANSMPGGIREEHKSRWLLLQIAPKTFLESDAFDKLTRQLRDAPDEYLSNQIETEKDAITKLLNEHALFCVLDEAQVPTGLASKCFRSEGTPNVARPVLRELIKAWKDSFPRLIVSGTGVSVETLESVLSSAVAKEGQEVVVVTDLGAFDSGEDQRAYMEQYLPPQFLDTSSGTELALRAAYWLHGR